MSTAVLYLYCPTERQLERMNKGVIHSLNQLPNPPSKDLLITVAAPTVHLIVAIPMIPLFKNGQQYKQQQFHL